MAQMRVNSATLIVLSILLLSIGSNGNRFTIKDDACPHPNVSFNSFCIKWVCEFQCHEDGKESGKCVGGLLTAKCCCNI